MMLHYKSVFQAAHQRLSTSGISTSRKVTCILIPQSPDPRPTSPCLTSRAHPQGPPARHTDTRDCQHWRHAGTAPADRGPTLWRSSRRAPPASATGLRVRRTCVGFSELFVCCWLSSRCCFVVYTVTGANSCCLCVCVCALVSSWEGGASQVTIAAESERRDERKRRWQDDYEEELDMGKVRMSSCSLCVSANC